MAKTLVLLAILGGVLTAVTGLAQSQTDPWQYNVDSCQYASINRTESRIVLNGATKSEALAVVLTSTALSDLAFANENETRSLVKGVPILQAVQAGPLSWDAFELLFERRSPADLGWQVINALLADDEKVRGIYLLSSQKGMRIGKGQRLTVVLAAKIPTTLAVGKTSAQKFSFSLPGYRSVEFKCPATALNLQMQGAASPWTASDLGARLTLEITGSEGKLTAEARGRIAEVTGSFDRAGAVAPSIAVSDVNVTGFVTQDGLTVSQRSGAVGVGIEDNTKTCSYLFPHTRVRGVSSRLEDAAGHGFELKKERENDPAVVTLLKRPTVLCLAFQVPDRSLRNIKLRLGSNEFTIAVTSAK